MTAFDLLHKRVLIATTKRGYASGNNAEEIKILEVSPSGNWIKIQDGDGRKYWRHYSDIVIVERLESLNKSRGE